MQIINIEETSKLRIENPLLYDVAQVITIIYGEDSFTISDLFRRLDTTWFNIKRNRFDDFMSLQLTRLKKLKLIEPGVTGALKGFKLRSDIVQEIREEHFIVGTLKEETINHGALSFLKIFVERVLFNNNWVNGTSIHEDDIFYGFPVIRPNVVVDLKTIDHFSTMVEYCSTHCMVVKREDRQYTKRTEPAISKFNKEFVKLLLEVTPNSPFKFSFANKHFTTLNKVANKNKCSSALYTLSRTKFLSIVRNTDNAIIFNEYTLTDKARCLTFE